MMKTMFGSLVRRVEGQRQPARGRAMDANPADLTNSRLFMVRLLVGL
jgi:hypothetical protein